ncbi:MAG: helix-turn-helix domain-containing protein [Cyclobacteriaceae bacterium]
MRRTLKIPRILKINWINDLSISVVFNNGDSRIIDFYGLMKSLNLLNSPAKILLNPDELLKVQLVDNTLSWDNVEQYITQRNGDKVKVPLEIGADVLFRYSKAEKSEFSIKIGRLIKENRLKSGMTQQELALKSGTTRTYISRIENERSDIELGTLRKIIETGLGKRIEIRIK